MKVNQIIQESRFDRRDAYQRDYDSSVSGMGRGDDHRGLRQELAHERNNIQIAINGRPWKVVAGRGTADSAEERSNLENMKQWAERKSASSGKTWTVYLTGAEVSESQGVAEGSLNEFAPGDGGDSGEEDTLHKYARMWYRGDDAVQQQVEQILNGMGWEIGEIESEEGGAFVVQSGDEHGDSYIGFAVADLTEGWKSALGSAALAGAMAMGGGMGHAQAADLSNYNTQYLQQVASGEHPRPMVSVADAKAELQARANGKQQVTAPARIDSPSGPQGFSKEYLQKAADPNRVGRYMISIEKAQELLNNMQEGVAEGKVEPQVDHRGDVDFNADIEVLGVDYNTGTWKITYNGKPYTVKADYFSREDFSRWQIPDYDVEIINRNGQNIMNVIDWDNEGSSKTDRQIRMVNTIIAYLDTENAQDIQYMAWKDQELDNVTAYEFYNDIRDFYHKDQQKIDQTVQWLFKNMTNDEAREGLADYIKNPVNPMDWNTKENLKKNRPYNMYVAFSYSREGNTEMTPGMNLPKIQLNDPDDEDELQYQLDALFKKVDLKFDAFENKIVELSKKFSLPNPDLGSGMGNREMFWELICQTAWPKEYKYIRTAATNILNFKAAVDKYAKSFNSSLIKIGLPGISEYAIWYGVLSDDLTEQQVNYFATPEGFANVANGKIDVSKMINDNMQRKSLEEKLGDNRPKLGSKRDMGKSIRKWRKTRGLDETDQVNEKSVSQAQFRTMAAAAHNPKFAKKVGIKQSVAKEFNQADKGSNYKKLPDRTNEGGDVFMANIKDTPEYKAGFATGKLPVPHPEGTQQYASYYKGVIDKASPTLNKVGEGELDEGWKSALGAAALAGTMAMGGGAHARVSGDYVDNPEINRLTGQPKVTQQISPDAAKPAVTKPGFSKEYLQSVVDGTHPRPLISKERAQELLQQQTTNEQGEQQKGADYRDPPEADYGDDYQDMVARMKKLAGLGPLKTVYDPAKRVYRNIPTAVQPKK